MKSKVAVCALCLVLFMLGSPLQAQQQETPIGEPDKLRLHGMGATLGLGVADMNMSRPNSRLQALGIGQFYDQLAIFNLSVYAGFRGRFGLSVDISGGSSLGGKEEYSPDASINFNTFSFGPTLYYSLLTTNRVRLMVLGGMRMNEMSFKYNADAFAAPDFDGLLAAPSASSNNVVVMRTAFPAESARLGAGFQYRLGKKRTSS